MNTTQQRAAIVRNQARIIDLLQWNEEKYAAFMYECGLIFLSAFIGDDDEAINMLTPKTEFWNWWKNAWRVRDDVFINEWDGLEDVISTRDLERLYECAHNPKILASEIHPPKIVYGNNFEVIQMETA